MNAKENREFKSSVFVDLFYEDESATKNDIALYNALHDEQLPEETTVQKIRIDKVLYMNFKNDISFGISDKVLIFGEHQSTINENMPLRSLMYVGRAYEQIVPVRSRYKKEQVPLPTPEFYTFYNGNEKWAKEKILKLSDSYITQDDSPMLELTVKVINIRSEENHELLEKCQVLKEYSQFVEAVAKYASDGKEDSYKRAIEECIQKGILADYLKRKGSEVINMLTAEYDYDMDIEVQREEAYENGMKAGIEIGKETGIEIGKKDGMKAGLELGKKDGMEAGMKLGEIQGTNRVNELIICLTKDGRYEDLVKSAKDLELQEKLMKEYNL